MIRTMRPIVVTVLKKTVKGVTRLEPTPVSFAAQQQIHDTRLMILNLASRAEREELKLAFQTARKERFHKDDPEPLLVLSRDLGDFLIWQVLDEQGEFLSHFSVDVHPFNDANKVPLAMRPDHVVPPAFDGKFPRKEKNKFVVSGLPSKRAVSDPSFWWHKYTLTLGDAKLDPCIYVHK